MFRQSGTKYLKTKQRNSVKLDRTFTKISRLKLLDKFCGKSCTKFVVLDIKFPFCLRRIGLVLKRSKVLEYYGQDCKIKHIKGLTDVLEANFTSRVCHWKNGYYFTCITEIPKWRVFRETSCWDLFVDRYIDLFDNIFVFVIQIVSLACNVFRRHNDFNYGRSTNLQLKNIFGEGRYKRKKAEVFKKCSCCRRAFLPLSKQTRDSLKKVIWALWKNDMLLCQVKIQL